MAKAIYALKIWMLRSKFQLKKREERGFQDIFTFTVNMYVKAWFTARSTITAPRKNLELIKNIFKYKSVNIEIS